MNHSQIISMKSQDSKVKTAIGMIGYLISLVYLMMYLPWQSYCVIASFILLGKILACVMKQPLQITYPTIAINIIIMLLILVVTQYLSELWSYLTIIVSIVNIATSYLIIV